MRSRTEARGSRGQDGFTLIELLVAIVILGIISVPLGNVVIAYLRNADATTGRLIESHDAQIASAYWAQDVASIGTRETTTGAHGLNQSVERDVAYDSGLFPCGAAGTPSAIVRLAWDESSVPGVTTKIVVAYVVFPGQTELHRLRCEGSAAVVSDVALAHDLDSSTPPAIQCSTAGVQQDCGAPAVPTTVTLKLTIKDPKNLDGAYVVQLTGQRRQS